jgi:ribonucleoside-diphosphate reductase alpha chain/ribonucleoside-triphosphate reductase
MNNSSNTIHMLSDEWATAAQEIHAIWDDYIGISFLAHDGGTYQLAPYEACTREQYEELRAMMKPFNPEMLRKYDNGEAFDVGNESCEKGACPIR